MGLSNAEGITQTNDIVNGTFSNGTITGSPISGSTGSFTTITATGNIASSGSIIPRFAIISAAGSAQATASLCSAQNCSLMGVADGQTTGFILMANQTGMAQTLFMNTAAVPFSLAANTLYTVLHYAASAMGVK